MMIVDYCVKSFQHSEFYIADKVWKQNKIEVI